MRQLIISFLMLPLAAPLAAQGQSATPPAAAQDAAVTSPVSQAVGMTEDEKADLNRSIRRFQVAIWGTTYGSSRRL